MKIFVWRTFFSPDNGSTVPSNISDSLCTPDQQKFTIIWSATVLVTAILTFPACVAVVMRLAGRRWCSGQRGQAMSSSSSSSSSNILLFNIMMFSFISSFSLLLKVISSLPPLVFTVGFSSVMIGGPVATLAISLDCYLAVVHPVRYMHIKTSWRLPEILTTLIWLYTVVMEIIIIAKDLELHSPVSLLTFYVFLPPYIFLNVSTLHALSLAGPERRRLADLSPLKRRAFWLIVVLLTGAVLYSCPIMAMFTYHAFTNVKDPKFLCVVYPMVMMIPPISATFITLFFFCNLYPAKWCKIMH